MDWSHTNKAETKMHIRKRTVEFDKKNKKKYMLIWILGHEEHGNGNIPKGNMLVDIVRSSKGFRPYSSASWPSSGRTTILKIPTTYNPKERAQEPHHFPSLPVPCISKVILSKNC